MPNIKITELPESTSIANDDLLVMVDSGNPYVTKKIAWKNIDAPQDDATYGRKNGSWIDIGSIEGNSFTVTNVDLHNGGIQSAQVLQFDDVTKQAVIIGPTPPLDSNAQRLIIQGHKASGTYAEGGDVYLWGGDSEYNGGDIKIYAGDADNVSPDNGYGGYVNIDGGRGTTNGGNVEITAGYSDEGQAGSVYIIGGSTSTGAAGNVVVRTNNNVNNWTFDLNGNFLVPGNIALANNSTIASGTYDNGTGGNGGISLNCVVGYELNWQGGHLKNTYNNGETNSNILCDSAIEFPGVDTDNVEINSTGIIFSDGTSQTSAGILDAPSDSFTYARKDGNWVDLYSLSNFQLSSGTDVEVNAYTPLLGEPIYDATNKIIYIGDGSTARGNLVSNSTKTASLQSQSIPGSSSYSTPLSVSLNSTNSIWEINTFILFGSTDGANETVVNLYPTISNITILNFDSITSINNANTTLNNFNINEITLATSNALEFAYIKCYHLVQLTGPSANFGVKIKENSALDVAIQDMRIIAKRIS